MATQQQNVIQGGAGRDELIRRLTFAHQLAERQQSLLAIVVLKFRSATFDAWSEVQRQDLREILPARLRHSLRALDLVGPVTPPATIEIVASLQVLDELDAIIRRLHCVVTSAEIGLPDIRTSIGVAVYPFDTGSPERLLELAAETADSGLQTGGHHYRYANAELEAWRQTSTDLQESIVRGLSRNEFEVLYQPVIAAGSGLPLAVEALLHWRHPERGVLPPADFLPSAERYSWLLHELDEWVLHEVAKAVPGFRRHLSTPLKISLNVCLPEILAGDFVANLRRYLEKHSNIDDNLLIIELPKHALQDERKRVESVIKASSTLGIGWAIDADIDRLSLEEMTSLPLQWIKLDTRALQDRLTESGRHEALRALGRLVFALGSRPVFTHVEDDRLRQVLSDDPNMLLQGFGIAAPMPVQVLQNWLKSRR